eukprot:scaffold968_cov171-Amphora_coffeaeformis.AAC.2
MILFLSKTEWREVRITKDNRGTTAFGFTYLIDDCDVLKAGLALFTKGVRYQCLPEGEIKARRVSRNGKTVLSIEWVRSTRPSRFNFRFNFDGALRFAATIVSFVGTCRFCEGERRKSLKMFEEPAIFI